MRSLSDTSLHKIARRLSKGRTFSVSDPEALREEDYQEFLRTPQAFPRVVELAKAMQSGAVSQSVLEAAAEEVLAEADNIRETGDEDALLYAEDLAESIRYWIASKKTV